MEETLKNYEKTIKGKHSISWTPKYKEVFSTNVSEKAFMPIVENVLERLGWDLVYKDKLQAEAKRGKKELGHKRWTEMITIQYDSGIIEVKSESLGNELWDLGRNAKRVKLFIFTFEDTVNQLGTDSLKTLIEATEIRDRWDDYVIPRSLPQPGERKTPIFAIPLVGGILFAVILSFVLAFVSVKGIYIIGFFEFLVAAALAFVMKYLVKLSNFTNFSRLMYLFAGIIILIYLCNQYFQYEIILYENSLDRIGFGEFIKLRLAEGLTINKINTGWIGLVISWLLQLGLTMLFVYLKMINHIVKILVDKIPTEVLDFATYHFVKGKSEEEVRNELAQKGWIGVDQQDEVFNAIGAVQSVHELNRIK